MNTKVMSFIVLAISSFFSLNAFAYLYGAKLTVNNNTSDDLILSLVGSNNISRDNPFVSKDGDNPNTMDLIYLQTNSKTTIYLDNFDWSGLLYQNKYTYFGVFKDLIHDQPVLVSKGMISIVTGATMWNMYAYINAEHPLVYVSQYQVEATPDYEHSKFDTAGNLADLTLNIYVAKPTVK